MPSLSQAICVLVVITCFTSCATIFGKTAYTVKLHSIPNEAMVTVFNRKGIEIFSDTTPCQVKLKSNAGYFRRAIYTMEFTKDGYRRSTEVVRARVNPFYYGNILFGGYIGFLLVDPLTGAMYKLETREINQILSPDRQGEPIRM